MSPRVLVVDDEPDFVELISYSLESHGYKVMTARNGVEAVQKVERSHPDAIVLDLMMPGLDGFSACEQLRKRSLTRTLPIIIVTAATGQLARLNALAAGATDLIVKPFSPAELVNRVALALAQA